MKNRNKIIQLFLLLFLATKSFGQLPLKYGDGVITHSPNSYTSSGPSLSPAVARIIHTSNTTSAPLGANWVAPSPKPNNDFYPNWTVDSLGYVFGITLDNDPTPNIYISSTQIYNNTTINERKVWRLNGSSGSHSLVYDFNNPSGSGVLKSHRSLGNLKYGRFGSTENIYVSDWQTGEIHRLTGNSMGSSIWANQTAFIPKFGKNQKDPNEMPYGLAIRRISASQVKLYYAKVSTNSNSNSYGGYGNNEIYSVDINPINGDFMPSTESLANIPNINRDHSHWGGYGTIGTITSPISYGCQILPVISDLDFTFDGNRMLVGQQSWGQFGILATHNSEVKEFITDNLGNWNPSVNIFKAGSQQNGVDCSPTTNLNPGFPNSVGGVSYSNNILRKGDLSFGCDSSVYFTADFIKFTGGYPSSITNATYGVQGMKATGGDNLNSIWIDADDDLSFVDKTFLGDVEIYKNPQACAPPCECGVWDSIGYNNNGHWWMPSNAATQGSPVTTLSFNQGQTTGVLFPYYHCSGTNCSASYTYSLINPSGTQTSLSSSSSGLNLDNSILHNLTCGHYSISITPHCDSADCPAQIIPLEIVCLPLCDCKNEVSVKSDKDSYSVHVQSNSSSADPVSTIAGTVTLSSSKSVTEVRMLVDEFRLVITEGNENCLLCKNKPQTWGSINYANLTGVAAKTIISPAITNDIREFVFNNGPNTVFNLASTPLNFNLGLPGVTGLDCCKLKVEMCVKFIIRDIDCCETEIIKCISFDLK